MNVEDIRRKVVMAVAEQLGLKPDDPAINEIDPRKTFTELGLDSLDTVELAMRLEETFGLEIPDEDKEQISTVDRAVEYIHKKINL